MLETLSGNDYYCFLDGFSGYIQIPLALKDQEKTIFTCPYGTFSYRRMPFRLCNAPATFRRCMTVIFHDMCKDFIEVFMDDFSVFGPIIPTPSKVVKQGTEVTKDQVQTLSSQSTTPVQPSVVQSKTQTPVFELVVVSVSALMPNLKPSIPYPSRRDNERRSLIGNKEKLSEMARTPMNKNCSAVILNKLPRKLRDPDKFLIPCEFPRMDECLALSREHKSHATFRVGRIFTSGTYFDLHDS
nr:RNA-directed DNA polymerase homolog [Tanacetum cinerariifolium]